MIVGLEPGDEAGTTVRLIDFAEANEGMHLVRIAAHFLGHFLNAVEQRIGAILQRALILAHLEQQRIKQGEALGVAMMDGRPRQADEGLGNREGLAAFGER